MVYTIKNACVEETDLPYEDGARTIFLYTKGTEGNPPEELSRLARYLEYSVPENAQTVDLARLHEMVVKVKADREVGLAYMEALEIERRIREEGRMEGKEEGREEERQEGIRILILDNLEEQIPKERILKKLQRRYDLSEENAKAYYDRFVEGA